MNNLAFLVSCSHYEFEDTWSELPDTDFDITRIENVLSDNCSCNNDNIIICSDSRSAAYQPISSTIVRMIQCELKSRHSSYDIIFFYFSGHGFIDNGEVYIAPMDANNKEFTLTINRVIKEIESAGKHKHIVLIIDCCQNEIDEKAGIKAPCFSGHVVFYSCVPHQVSYLIPKNAQKEYGKGSIFTYCMASALSKESNCSTVDQVSEYLASKMAEVCNSFQYDQVPYTTLQDVQLGKMRITASDPSSAHIIFSDEEEKLIEKFAEKIDLKDNVIIASFGSGVLDNLNNSAEHTKSMFFANGSELIYEGNQLAELREIVDTLFAKINARKMRILHNSRVRNHETTTDLIKILYKSMQSLYYLVSKDSSTYRLISEESTECIKEARMYIRSLEIVRERTVVKEEIQTLERLNQRMNQILEKVSDYMLRTKELSQRLSNNAGEILSIIQKNKSTVNTITTLESDVIPKRFKPWLNEFISEVSDIINLLTKIEFELL